MANISEYKVALAVAQGKVAEMEADPKAAARKVTGETAAYWLAVACHGNARELETAMWKHDLKGEAAALAQEFHLVELRADALGSAHS